jgi:ribosomal protein S18 acetylase RimI-like enzyme
VGMVSGGWVHQDVELLSLWVTPWARGCGVGDRLVEAVVAWAQDHQAPRVMLSVRDHNAPAIRLNQRHGFQAIGPSSESEPGAPETRFVRAVL